MRRLALQFVFLIAVFGWFFSVESRRDLHFIEAGFADWLDANAPRPPSPAQVTLVEINAESLRQNPWPWSPLSYIKFLQVALQHRFGLAAIEPVLDWKKNAPAEPRGHLQYEKILQDSIRKMPKLLLGARLGFPEDPDVVPPLEAVPQIKNFSGDITRLAQFNAIEQEPPEEMRLSATLGFTNIPGGRAIARTVPLVFAYRGEVVPSFTLQAMVMWQKLTLDEVEVVLGSHVALGGAVKIPIDDRGNMRVDFRTKIKRLGSLDLLLAASQAETNLKPILPIDDFKNDVVILARTDAVARTLRLPIAIERTKMNDLIEPHQPRTNPLSGSSGELFAHAIATIQKKSFIRRAPVPADAAITVAAIALGIFALRLPRTSQLAMWISLIWLGYLLAAISTFGVALLALPFVLPTGLALFIFVFAALSPRGASQK